MANLSQQCVSLHNNAIIRLNKARSGGGHDQMRSRTAFYETLNKSFLKNFEIG